MTKFELLSKLTSIINFGPYEDDEHTKPRHGLLKAGAAVGVGVGGTLGHRAIRSTGGYAENIRKLTPSAGNIGERISTDGAPGLGNFVAGIPRRAAGVVNKVTPYKNAVTRTGADILKRARRLFSDRSESIEFSGGYVNTPQGTRKERGIGAHFNRNAAKYISGGVAAPTLGLSIGAGWMIDRARRKHNLEKTKQESKVSPDLAKGKSLSAKLDDIISFKAIDLGDSPDECMPYGGATASKKYFPTLYVSGRKKPLDMPDEGEATVKYRVRSRSMNKYGEDEEKHSADIEIHSIDPIKGGGGKKGKAKILNIQPDLARLSSKLDSIINFSDTRPRDTMGQYANQQEGAPNPNDMAKVYSRAQRTGIAEGATAATVGGVGAHVGKSAYDSLLTKIRASRVK